LKALIYEPEQAERFQNLIPFGSRNLIRRAGETGAGLQGFLLGCVGPIYAGYG